MSTRKFQLLFCLLSFTFTRRSPLTAFSQHEVCRSIGIVPGDHILIVLNVPKEWR
jgi:hypothetical protein